MRTKNRRKLRAAAVFAATVMLLCSLPFFSVSALEAPAIERVEAAYLYNIENERAVFEYNSTLELYPSASVKVMSALAAYECLRERMDEKITVEPHMIRSVTGNHVGIRAGDEIPVRDLFYAMLMRGANDATSILACVCSGSVEAFVSLMNRRAAELSMENTVYTNPTGMHDPDMKTTARDTAQAARVFSSYGELLDMSSAVHYQNDETGFNFYNRNAFVSKLNSLGTREYYYPEAKGMNFGSTEEGGYSLVTMAQREGLSYICVILGGGEDEIEGQTYGKLYAFTEAKKLLDYALGGFGYVKVLTTDKLVYDMPVSLCEETDRVMLVPAWEIKAYLPRDIDIETEITYSYTLDFESLSAPVAEGHKAGYISVYHGEELLGTADLITQNEIRLSGFLSALERIKDFSRSKFFICTVIALVVVTATFVIVSSVYRAKKAKSRSRFRFR